MNTNQMNYNYPHPPSQVQTPFDYFAKPNIPDYWPEFMQENPNYYPPQPQPQPQSQPQPQPHTQQPMPNHNQGIMNQFQDQSGQIDFNKMLSTVGQLATTVQQVSPILKNVGSFINLFR